MATLASAGRAPAARHAATTIARAGESARDATMPEPRRDQPGAMSRRVALMGSSSAAVVGARTLATSPPAVAADDFVKDPSFFAEWSYSQPADIIPYIKATAKEGDPVSVLNAMDTFGRYYPMYKLGGEKGAMLAQIVKERAPTSSVEVGTFLGYSAIWTASNLPPNGRLTCVEFEPRHAFVARELVNYAGFGDVVEILEGAGSERVGDVKTRVGDGRVADMIFMDHCKECYLPDLKLMEAAGLVGDGTVIVADNVIYPGAPDFLEYVDTSRGRYKTTLLEAAFEYDQVWKKDWVPQRDALSYSVYVGGGGDVS